MRAAAIVASILACACGSRVLVEPADLDATNESGGTHASATGSATTPSSTSVATTAASTAGDTSDPPDPDPEPTCPFICEPDGGSGSSECDPFVQDCPPGEKCMPWANDGGNSWNALKCVPIAPDPQQPGEPCTVEGSGVSGLDDCDIGSMCWDVDPETNMGTCVAMCVGDAGQPLCEDPCSTCIQANEGVLILCLPVCDPVAQDCRDGLACYPVNEDFGCFPDAAGPDLGSAGDPCEFINACDPGLFCAPPESVPGCTGAAGCCAFFCDPTLAEPCPNAAEGVECVPWDAVPDPCVGTPVGGCVLP
jgi:hypothetical protein